MGRKNYAIESAVKLQASGPPSKTNAPNRPPASRSQFQPSPPKIASTPSTNANPTPLCCSSFTGHSVHQGRFQYLGDRPLEITSSLKGYGNRGCSSDVIYRAESTESSRWRNWEFDIRGWKYLRWVVICAAILLVIGLIVFFSVADLRAENPANSRKETFFDGGGGIDVGDGVGGRLLSGDVVTLDGDVIVDVGGVTYREGDYRVTSGQPISDMNPGSEKNNNGSADQDFMQIVAAPDLATSTVINLNDSTAVTQESQDAVEVTTTNANIADKEKSYTDFIHTIPDLVLKVHSLIEKKNESNTNSSKNSTLYDLQQKESKHNIPDKKAPYEEAEEIMMTSDRDLSYLGDQNHRSKQMTNAHSRQPVHPTIPSSILKKTKELLGDPFAPANETETSCFSTRLDICKGVLPYDLTTLPLVPGVTRLADLDAALPYFEMILQSGCSKRAPQFICSVLEPECQPLGNNVLPPCRKTCKAVAEDCSDFMLATLDLSKVFHCDLYPDEPDGRQCVNFAKGDSCLDDEFRCNDGTCIPQRWQCDNIGDCQSSEDEANCSHCTDNEFKCKKDAKCIPLNWQCNGNKDCSDGSDEAGCLQLAETSSGHSHASPCPAGELRCVDGRCITMQQLCDNVHDCTDGADEGNCGSK